MKFSSRNDKEKYLPRVFFFFGGGGGGGSFLLIWGKSEVFVFLKKSNNTQCTHKHCRSVLSSVQYSMYILAFNSISPTHTVWCVVNSQYHAVTHCCHWLTGHTKSTVREIDFPSLTWCVFSIAALCVTWEELTDEDSPYIHWQQYHWWDTIIAGEHQNFCSHKLPLLKDRPSGTHYCGK